MLKGNVTTAAPVFYTSKKRIVSATGLNQCAEPRRLAAAFFLGEYTAMILFSVFGTVLFLGAWDPGIPLSLEAGIGRWVGVLVVFTKAFVLIFVMIWLRWSLPRFRIDKVMYLCYKVLLPWSVVCVVGTALQVLIGHSLGCGWLMGR